MNAEKKKGWHTHTCSNTVKLMLQESSHSEKTMYQSMLFTWNICNRQTYKGQKYIHVWITRDRVRNFSG